MKLTDYMQMIEVEAIRRAALNIDAYIDASDKLTPGKVRNLQLMLARRYDKLVAEYQLDAPGLLAERIKEQA
jgi:hypothetical protein